ncbi:AHH domain-containing protein [Neobacillus drentensis]|uniref:AHH domain-containing protein n=1 Tax=Neobacillus drentensis TaxID=220684 RepID=UPI003B588589
MQRFASKGTREANLKKQGFQEHHIISDKNKLTKNHELLDEAGYDLQSRNNSVSENLARQMGGLNSNITMHCVV